MILSRQLQKQLVQDKLVTSLGSDELVRALVRTSLYLLQLVAH